MAGNGDEDEIVFSDEARPLSGELPLRLLKTLEAMQRLVTFVARQQFLAKHPSRSRFSHQERFDLSLTELRPTNSTAAAFVPARPSKAARAAMDEARRMAARLSSNALNEADVTSQTTNHGSRRKGGPGRGVRSRGAIGRDARHSRTADRADRLEKMNTMVCIRTGFGCHTSAQHSITSVSTHP